MDWLIWTGAAVSIVGVAGLVWCILRVNKDRKAGLDDEALKERLQTAVAINMASFMVSALGLAMVVAGIFLS